MKMKAEGEYPFIQISKPHQCNWHSQFTREERREKREESIYIYILKYINITTHS